MEVDFFWGGGAKLTRRQAAWFEEACESCGAPIAVEPRATRSALFSRRLDGLAFVGTLVVPRCSPWIVDCLLLSS